VQVIVGGNRNDHGVAHSFGFSNSGN
jgi:hypothetical protein